MIPAALLDVTDALTESKLALPSGSGDARRDSSSAENAPNETPATRSDFAAGEIQLPLQTKFDRI